MNMVIIQPSFLPWRGYFHLIERSDIFVFYDDVQYDKHSWRNRNIIKTAQGPLWVTVPVLTRNKFGQKINEVQIDNVSNPAWGKKIWNSISLSYNKSQYFKEFSPFFQEIFQKKWENLAELDIYTTEKICAFLGIKRKFYRSSELSVSGERVERIIKICRELGCDRYISGPSARDYITSDKEFQDNAIKLEFHHYDYPDYQQQHNGFLPQVSIIDLLFNCGRESGRYIWGEKEEK